MKLQRKIGSFNTVVHCPEDLREQAEALLDKLSEINNQDSGLKDGMTIEFGWSILTLRGNEDELLVCEPYFSNDPFQSDLPVVDETLRVMSEQIALLNRVGVEGVTTHFRDKVVVDKGCIHASQLYLERKPPQASTNNSGWYIGEVREEETKKTADELEALYTYQLLNQRRSVMQVLALPPGYLVIIDGDSVTAIFNEDNQNIW